MIEGLVAAMRDLGLVVSDDGSGRPGVERIDRGWSLAFVDHTDASDAAGEEPARLSTLLRLSGEYQRRHPIVDELRAADDIVAITTTLPLAAGVITPRDRATVQAPIGVEAAIDVVYIDETGAADLRDRTTQDGLQLVAVLRDPRTLAARPGADHLRLQRAVGRALDSRRLAASFELTAAFRPGTGGRWSHIRSAIEGAALEVGWVTLDDAGEPNVVLGAIQLGGRAAVRLRSLAGATLTHRDDGWIAVELDFLITEEAP